MRLSDLRESLKTSDARSHHNSISEEASNSSTDGLDVLYKRFLKFDPDDIQIYFSNPEIVVDPDMWLVHFTDKSGDTHSSAESIRKNGFKYGIRWKATGDKLFGFAFDAESPEAHTPSMRDRYGENIVLFQCDRVLFVKHEDDLEDQVIFPLEKTKNRHTGIWDGDVWVVKDPNGKKLGKASKMREVLALVRGA